jgi:hypothetical protein
MYKQPVLEFNTPTTNNHIVFFPSFGGINFQMCPKKHAGCLQFKNKTAR